MAKRPVTEPIVPEDLQAALAENSRAEAEFLRMPPSHRHEYIRWIEDAKKSATRIRRINGLIERLRESNIYK